MHVDSRIDSVVGSHPPSPDGGASKANAPVELKDSQISFLRTAFTNSKGGGGDVLVAADSASALRLEGVQMASSNEVLRHVQIELGGKVTSSSCPSRYRSSSVSQNTRNTITLTNKNPPETISATTMSNMCSPWVSGTIC